MAMYRSSTPSSNIAAAIPVKIRSRCRPIRMATMSSPTTRSSGVLPCRRSRQRDDDERLSGLFNPRAATGSSRPAT